MNQPFRDRSRTRSGFRCWSPAVGVFYAVTFILWLVGRSVPGLADDLVLRPGQVTLEGFFTSHLYHKSFPLLALTLLAMSSAVILESRWGTPRFVAFYFSTALGTALVTLLSAFALGEEAPSCGAMGVAMASIVAAGYLYPEHRLARFAPPAKHLAWVIVFLLGTYLVLVLPPGSTGKPDLFLLPQVSGPGFALLFLCIDPWCQRLVEKRRARRREQEKIKVVAIRHRVDDLLEKISSEGYESLTRDEKAFLRQASKHYRVD